MRHIGAYSQTCKIRVLVTIRYMYERTLRGYVLDVFALVLLGDGDVATARLELELLHDAERLVVD